MVMMEIVFLVNIFRDESRITRDDPREILSRAFVGQLTRLDAFSIYFMSELSEISRAQLRMISYDE